MAQSDFNICTFTGRVVRDAELQYTSQGTAFSNIGIAVNRHYKDKHEVSFFNTVLWGKRAESLNQYLVKGKLICISAEAVQNRWESNGQTQSRVVFHIKDIQLLSDSNPRQEQLKPAQHRAPEYETPENFEDDIPF